MAPAASTTSLSAAISFTSPCVITFTPVQRVPTKFNFTTSVFNRRVRLGRDSAGRRNARAALTRVPSAPMFMLMKPAPGRQGPFMSSRMGIPISRAASTKAGAVG